MENKEKIILDLFAGSGSWSEPYTAAEYDVRRITLPTQDVTTYIPPKKVYGILAACPCEVLGRVAARHWKNREPDLILTHCSFVTHVLLIVIKTNPKFWCIENPPGKMTKLLKYPAYKFQPYEFGHPYTKNTFLWGDFSPPFAQFTNITNKTHRHIEAITKNRSQARSITPAKFAKAFFNANR